MKKKPILKRIASRLITLIVPFTLLLTGVRLLLTPVFIQIEYHTPNFPEDRYGMTLEERLHWAPVALEFILNEEEISFLGDLEFDDGSLLFNERELGHMEDVKVVVTYAINVWYALVVFLVGFGFWFRREGWWDDFLKRLAFGGLLTVGIILSLLVFLLISFKKLFIVFHALFFEGDSWLFPTSDTLIRLFPVRFWQDAFISVGVFAFLGGLVLWFSFKKRRVKTQGSKM
jgi:integral membrane protein (TIGR01906 family)